MKKYWIRDGKFGNIYSLFWTDSEEMEKHLPEHAYQITRQAAIRACKAENERRKYMKSMAGVANNHIFPADMPKHDYDCHPHIYHLNGYIVERN